MWESIVHRLPRRYIRQGFLLLLPSFSLSGYPLTTPASLTSSLPQPNTALEGWRAVLTLLLRYGMAQRQRQAEFDVFGVLAQPGSTTSVEEDGTQNEIELDNVKAMVAGVKERGVRVYF